MRAMVMSAYGGPEALSLQEAPRPVPGSGQMLLRVLGHSVNPVDWKLASGKLRPLMTASFPHIPGYDVSGEVVELGPGATGFSVGERVVGRLTHASGGAAAEYCLLGTDVAAPVPAGLDPVLAAGLPLAGMTALQGLRDKLGMPLEGASGRVLIVGASGGVGHFAVQLAVGAGATVIGVCSGRNEELVLGLGAHEVIDYTAPDPYAGQAPFDLIYDCVGGAYKPWLARLTPKGAFASSLPDAAIIARSLVNGLSARQVHPVMLKSNSADLRTLLGWVEAGRLRVHEDSRFSLEELPQSWASSAKGRTRGKIIVEIGQA